MTAHVGRNGTSPSLKGLWGLKTQVRVVLGGEEWGNKLGSLGFRVCGLLIWLLKVLIINVFKCLSNYPTSFLFISVWRLFVILFEFNNFFHLKKKKREKKEVIWRTIMGVKACCFWWISNHAKQSHINIFFFNPKKKKSRYNEKMIGKKPSEILCVKNSVPLAKLVFP